MMAAMAVMQAASEQRGEEPDPGVHQRGGAQAAHADERELSERELAGPAREHGERQGDHGVEQDSAPRRALGRQMEEHERNQGHEGDEARRRTCGSDRTHHLDWSAAGMGRMRGANDHRPDPASARTRRRPLTSSVTRTTTKSTRSSSPRWALKL